MRSRGRGRGYAASEGVYDERALIFARSLMR